MEPVMLVEVLDVHGHVQVRQRVTGAGGQCRIGRSLRCDVTVDDPYLASEHVRLTLQQDGRVLVQDLHTRNGTRVDDLPVDPQTGRLISRGELQVGRTHVRVRTEEGELPAERAFRKDLLRRHRSQLAVAGLLLCFTFAAFLQWSHAPEQLGQRILIAELVVSGALSLWVATWCLVSRLTAGAWQVRIHLAIAAVCVGLWMWGYWLYTVAAFALQWNWIGPFAVVLAALVALGAAYLHLRHATHLRPLVSLLLAVLVPPLLGGVWWVVDQQVDPRTVNRMASGPAIYPPALRLSPSMDLNDYLTDVAALKREASRNRQESLLETPVLDTNE
jgi:hypothetical protein